MHEALRRSIKENDYPLENKDVRVQEDLPPCAINAPEALCRIVWSNITRNAFQHTYEGGVEIKLSGPHLTVINDIAPDVSDNSSESHGLGLMLIQGLTDSQGWDLDIRERPGNYTVTLFMGEEY